MLAYSGVFAAASRSCGSRRAAGRRCSAASTLAAVVVCGYALLTKIFPGSLATSDTYARLQEPYGYWNAIGLTAAMGAIGCLWLGARRSGHALLSALAYPAMGVLLLTLVLAYSRGALVALAVGLLLWFCIVPLRLRGAAVLLIVAALAAGAVGAWDFSTHALSSDSVALAERTLRRPPARRAGRGDAPRADASSGSRSASSPRARRRRCWRAAAPALRWGSRSRLS